MRFDEFVGRVPQIIFVSATPGDYELSRRRQVVEQIMRPTGLVDPEVEVRPATGQVDDLVEEIRPRVEKRQRVLVTTLTKRMSEDLTDYLSELGIKVRYLHSEVDTLERMEILRDLRLGSFDVLVGINLLREGLDLPEVSLVAILDADKEGFLRVGAFPDPDQRPGVPAPGRQGDHVCRHRHRLDPAGDRRDRPPALHPGGLQPALPDHAPFHPEGGPGDFGDYPARVPSGRGGERRDL